jgi:serine/threonine protein kinase
MSDPSTGGTEDTLLQLPRSDPSGASRPRANPILAPGTEVGPFEIRNVVGRGAMGIVYRAREIATRREVAVKLCATEAEGDTCSLLCSLLVREGETMGRLSHPNLVAVLDIGQFNHCIYVAMEYVEGTNLRVWANDASRSSRERLHLMLDAGRGLAAAHDGGVVHRDFKPDNVLVGRDGGVKVTDFGLARILGGTIGEAGPPNACGCGPSASAAADGAVVGTPKYMAPEVLDGATGDERSDQFSYATSTWELLHGEPPFAARDAASLRRAIAAGALAEPAAGSSPSTRDALRRALHGDPSSRYPSMTALVAALAERVAEPSSAT